MRLLPPVTLVLLALSAFVPTSLAGPSCTVPSQAAAEPVLDDVYYLRISDSGATDHVQLWRESNDIPGLQTINWRCAAGDAWPADTLMASVPIALVGNMPL